MSSKSNFSSFNQQLRYWTVVCLAMVQLALGISLNKTYLSPVFSLYSGWDGGGRERYPVDKTTDWKEVCFSEIVFPDSIQNQTFPVSTNKIAVLDSCVSRSGSVDFRHTPSKIYLSASFSPYSGWGRKILSSQNHRLLTDVPLWDGVLRLYSKPNFSSFSQQNCGIGQS